MKYGAYKNITEAYKNTTPFIFKEDTTLSATPLDGTKKLNNVSFKKGDIINGIVVINNQYSEPPNFVESVVSQGLIRIGYGGRSGSVVEPIPITTTPTPTPPTSERATEPKKENTLMYGILAVGIGLVVYSLIKK